MSAWTVEQTWLLQLLRPTCTVEQLADALGRSVCSVKARLATKGIKQGRRRPWSDADIATLRKLWPDHTAEEVAEQIGHSPSSIYKKTKKLRLAKSAAFMATRAHPLDPATGAAFRFRKGQVPQNKGIKGWLSGGRSAETRFKPGIKPHTWVPVGTQVLDDNGYLKTKVRDDASPGQARFNWIYEHRRVWVEHHGPIPAGFVVGFKDGNKANVAPENLLLISLADNARRNSIHNYPPELREVIRLQARLQRTIQKVSREKQDR